MEVQSTGSESSRGSLGKTHTFDQENLALISWRAPSERQSLADLSSRSGEDVERRPITSVSSDPQDLEALTPNHILLLRRNPFSPLDLFEESDKSKARWKYVHLLANEFWQRWTKEYWL